MDVMEWTIAIALAYLAGSIPFGALIARLKGVNIREHGSKNIGATNVGRVLGKKWQRDACRSSNGMYFF